MFQSRSSRRVMRAADHPGRQLPRPPRRPGEIRGGLAAWRHSLPSQISQNCCPRANRRCTSKPPILTAAEQRTLVMPPMCKFPDTLLATRVLTGWTRTLHVWCDAARAWSTRTTRRTSLPILPAHRLVANRRASHPRLRRPPAPRPLSAVRQGPRTSASLEFEGQLRVATRLLLRSKADTRRNRQYALRNGRSASLYSANCTARDVSGLKIRRHPFRLQRFGVGVPCAKTRISHDVPNRAHAGVDNAGEG